VILERSSSHEPEHLPAQTRAQWAEVPDPPLQHTARSSVAVVEIVWRVFGPVQLDRERTGYRIGALSLEAPLAHRDLPDQVAAAREQRDVLRVRRIVDGVARGRGQHGCQSSSSADRPGARIEPNECSRLHVRLLDRGRRLLEAALTARCESC
jgi:hypothetical protein